MAATATASAGLPVDPGAQQALESQGVYLSGPDAQPRAVLLFPGHGAQYSGLCAELSSRYPVVRDTFRRIDDVYTELTGHPLTDRMFSAGSGDSAQSLEDPEVVQPAIFAASIAVYQLLAELGVDADVFAGHSLGELTALVAAGALTIEDGVRAMHGRGVAVKTIDPGRRGAMISLHTGSADHRALVTRLVLRARAEGGQVTASIVNSPTHTVFSGDASTVEKIAEECRAHNVEAVRLPVSHGYHSELLVPAVPVLARTLAALPWRAARKRVLSGILGDYYTAADVEHLPGYLAQQLVTPFDFSGLVERLYGEGVRVFIETGPKGSLSGLVRRILAGRTAFVISTNVPSLGAVESIRRFTTFAEVHGLRGQRESAGPVRDLDGPPTGSPSGPTRAELLRVVAWQTGYPAGLLDPVKLMGGELGLSTRVRADVARAVCDRLGIPLDGCDPALDRTLGEFLDELTVRARNSYRAGGHTPAGRVIEPAAVEPAVVLGVEPAVGRAVADPDQPGAVASADRAAVERVVLETVQAKTAYPAELLELDLDLEGELGIDSLKQAEILGALRDRFALPELEKFMLAELSTLRKIVAFVSAAGKRPAVQEPDMPSRPVAAPELSPARAGEPVVVGQVIDQVARRYVPLAVPRPLGSSGPTGTPGIELAGISVLVIADRDGAVCRVLLPWLGEAGARVRVVCPALARVDGAPAVRADFTDASRLAAAIAEARGEVPVQVVVNLYALGPDTHGGSTFGAPAADWTREVDTQFTVQLLAAKACYADLEAAGKSGAYLAATSIGGAFGIEGSGAVDPLGGLTTGFVKSLAAELPEIRAKVVDFDQRTPEQVARALYDELVAASEVNVEVAYASRGRETVLVMPHALNIGTYQVPLELGDGDVVVLTGAGRGITYECAKALAGIEGITLAILGRTPLPAGTEHWLALDDADFAGYRMDCLRRAKRDDPTLTPAAMEAGFAWLAHGRTLYRNLAELRVRGCRVWYETCDVADRAQVRAAIGRIRARFGQITGVVHGAGLPSGSLVPRKPLDHALQVVRTKVNGAYHLWHALQDDAPKFVVLFGSLLGRTGMDGQVDYAAAADVLPKIATQLSRERPACRAFTMAWTAWAETGMAASEDVRRVQEGQRGLGYISVAEGVQTFLHELLYGGRDPEVVVVGDIGTNSWRGQDAALDATRQRIATPVDGDGVVLDRLNFPLLDSVRRVDAATLRAEQRLAPDADQYLADHRVRGVPTVAGAFILEGQAETAALLCPDEVLVGASDVEFNRFVMCHPAFALTLSIEARLGAAGVLAGTGEQAQRVDVVTRSDLVRLGGPVLTAGRLHARGSYWFADTRPAATAADRPIRELLTTGRPLDLDDFYADTAPDLAFGPAFTQLRQVRVVDDRSIVAKLVTPDNRRLLSVAPSPYMRTMPVVVDNAWRALLVWAYHFLGRGHSYVPVSIGSARFYRVPLPTEPAYAFGTVTGTEGPQDARLTVDVQLVDDADVLLCDFRRLVVARPLTGRPYPPAPPASASIRGDHYADQ